MIRAKFWAVFFAAALLYIATPVSSAQAACANPVGAAGDLYFNTTHDVLQYCNNTDWVATGKGPGTGGGCANPAGAAGQIYYNTDYRVTQFCNGNEWVAMGPKGGSAGNRWTQIDSGAYHVCGIRANGTLWCWGLNDSGQIGTGTAATAEVRASPEQEVTAATNWASVSAGAIHTCGIKINGTLYCWGWDLNGQLGDGAATGIQSTPVQESTAATNWVSVSAGNVHSCAVKTNGTLWCWGNDDYGQLGNGATGGTQTSPVQESTAATNWVSVSAWSNHTCALKTNGTLWCWGYDAYGQLGNGVPSSNQVSPVQESSSATNWASVSVGTNYSCATKTNGTLYCWGYGIYGQLGDGGTSSSISPTQESTAATNWALVRAGDVHTCAVKTNGTLYCWGFEGFGAGALGNGPTTGSQLSPVQEATASTNWTSAGVGINSSCALKTDGTLWCWGDDDYGQSGNGSGGGNPVSPTGESSGATNWANVSGGRAHTCGVKMDGTLWCWGEGYYGQLGDGTGTFIQLTPVRESTSSTNWASVSAAGEAHTCAIKTNGTIWCWGYAGGGQLGNGTTAPTQLSPVQEVTAATNWSKLAVGNNHACAIKTNGTLWCWGDDTYSQLGNGATTGAQSSPVQESTSATDWAFVDASLYHTCAVKTNGTLWCWGDDGYDKLGNGPTNTSQESPVQEITAATDWASVSLGATHTCALKTNGTIWCWGDDNTHFQLGNGATTGIQDSPVQEVTAATDWAAVDAGGAHTCALKTSGAIWCWGSDAYNQLGNGATTGDLDSPVQIGSGWAKIGMGNNHSCAIGQSPATLSCWGYNNYAQTGTGVPIGNSPGRNEVCMTRNGVDYGPGAMFYNTSSNTLQYCDALGWVKTGR